ncbi:hypothetical protein Tco_0113301, partial [Tanacetum coccineum]
MVCGFGLVLALLYKSSKTSSSWDVLVVRVQYLQSNPSPWITLSYHLTIDVDFGLSVCARGEGYRGNGLWELVRVSCLWYLGGGLGRKTMGKGGLILAGNGYGTVMVTGLKDIFGKDALM